MDLKKSRIFVIVPPGSGHINPVLCLIAEIIKKQQVTVVFYSEESFREQIEKVGAIYRAYSHPTYSRVTIQKPINEYKLSLAEYINKQIEIAYDVLPQLLRDCETETPDMIIYDTFFFMSNYLLEIIRTREAAGKWKRKVPKSVLFVPEFAPCPRLLKALEQDMQHDWWSYLLLIDTFRRQFIFSWWYGISIYNPINLTIKSNDALNIVAVPSELQPFREDFNDTFKFVGPCVNDQARSAEINNDEELKSVLAEFKIKEPGKRPRSDDKKLIYVSMGTVFLANTFIFEQIFEAFRDYDSNPARNFKLAQFRVIVSVGTEDLKIFKEKIIRGEENLPKNILLRARVPQLEVLKRANLFLTHCGMNSTTETIKYGVPVVAIPIDADQPMNARRICDELEFGLRLDVLKLNSNEIADSVDAVLSNSKYRRNIGDMAKSIERYNGAVEGARYILDYLNRKE